MADDLPVGSPLWWVARLEKKLEARRPQLLQYDSYYEGDQRLTFATPKYRETFGGVFDSFADNWCDLIVDAVEERLNVEGFRFGKDDTGARKAWSMWQANQLDADSQVAHNEALVFGESSVTVWNNPADDKNPAITIESPLQMIVEYETNDPRTRAAAFKKWIDDDGYELATLYLPDAIYKYRSRNKVQGEGHNLISSVPNVRRWNERESANEPWPLPNPFGKVNVVPLINRPRLLKPGKSEIARVIPLQDAVNKLTMDMLVASEFGAAPQRWATGLETPKDPETGQPMQVFENLVSRVWASKSKDTTFGQFQQTDLHTFVEGIEMLVQHIASQTRTPPHYFALNGQFPSGESIKSAETGLVAKARRKMRHFGESWEEVMSLAFAVIGDEKRAAVTDSELIWGDPESRSESQHIDSVVKLLALEVPRELLWERAGFTPQEIERMQELVALREIPALPEPTHINPAGKFSMTKAVSAAEMATGNDATAPAQAPA